MSLPRTPGNEDVRLEDSLVNPSTPSPGILHPYTTPTNPSPAQTTDPAPGELTAVVDELLNQLSNKFSTISAELLAKSKSPPPLSAFALEKMKLEGRGADTWSTIVDDMSRRLDNLEATIQGGGAPAQGGRRGIGEVGK